MTETNDERIVLFDGVCNLCNRAVQFIIRNDPAVRFKFCALQSAEGSRLTAGLETVGSPMDTVILFENGILFERSTAALRIAKRLRSPWNLCGVLLVVPAPIRDLAYKYIAANRYR